MYFLGLIKLNLVKLVVYNLLHSLCLEEIKNLDKWSLVEFNNQLTTKTFHKQLTHNSKYLLNYLIK